MHPVDQVAKRVFDTRPHVLAVGGALVFEHEPRHLLPAVQVFGRAEAVGVAGGYDLDVVRQRHPIHAPVAHDLLEQAHAVARVHLVEEHDDPLGRGGVTVW